MPSQTVRCISLKHAGSRSAPCDPLVASQPCDEQPSLNTGRQKTSSGEHTCREPYLMPSRLRRFPRLAFAAEDELDNFSVEFGQRRLAICAALRPLYSTL